jgi:hypothetical protein
MSKTPLTDAFNALKDRPADALAFYRKNREAMRTEQGDARREKFAANYAEYEKRMSFRPETKP